MYIVKTKSGIHKLAKHSVFNTIFSSNVLLLFRVLKNACTVFAVQLPKLLFTHSWLIA